MTSSNEDCTTKQGHYVAETFVQQCPICPTQIRWREISVVTSSRQRGPRPANGAQRFRTCHWCAEKEHRANEWARLNREARELDLRCRAARIAYTQGRVLQ